MARPVTTLVVFFVAFNLFAGLIGATGVDTLLGIDAEVGEDDQIQQRVNNAEEVETGTGLGDTLFGMYNVLAGFIGGFFDVIFPGLVMLERAGVPKFITEDFLSPLFSIIIAIGMVSFLRGWNL